MVEPDQSKKQDRIDQKTEVTTRISETSRFVGVGIVAWVFAQHASGEKFALEYLTNFGAYVRFAGVLGVLVIVFDYLQYIAAYFSVKAALRNEENNYAYGSSPAWWVQTFCFWLKQGAAVIAALIIVVTFAASISVPASDQLAEPIGALEQ